jgi:hypothetical protein
MDYVWNDNSSGDYDRAVGRSMTILLPDGSRETIAQLGVDNSRKTLGVYTCLSGNLAAQLLEMEVKVRKWSSRLLNSRLPAKWAWVSYNLQLWTSLRYGLSSLSTPFCELGNAFPRFARTILPRLGVNRNLKRECRHLHPSYCGFGLFSLPIEATIARVNMFLQHWGSPTIVGISLQTTMELLQL